MPPKKGRGRKKKDIDTKKMDDIADIIGVPPLEHRVLRDKDRSMIKITKLLKGNPRNRAPKVPTDTKKNEGSYFESKEEYHPDKGHRNVKVAKVDLKVVKEKINVHGASKRKLAVPKQVVNNETTEADSKKSKTNDKVAMKIINQMKDPTSLYHNTTFKEMVYLKETLNDMSDSEFDSILNSSSPVWWEQDDKECEDAYSIGGTTQTAHSNLFNASEPTFDAGQTDYTFYDPDEPPPEYESEPSCSISEELERLNKTECKEKKEKKMTLSNLVNSIKQKSRLCNTNIEEKVKAVTEIRKEVELENELKLSNSSKDSGKLVIYDELEEKGEVSPEETRQDEVFDTKFVPTVITIIEKNKFQQTEDTDPETKKASEPLADSPSSNGSNDTKELDDRFVPTVITIIDNINSKLVKSKLDKDLQTMDPELDDSLNSNDFIDKQCEQEKYMDENLCSEKQLNFLTDICKLKRKHDETARNVNKYSIKSKKMTTFTSDDDDYNGRDVNEIESNDKQEKGTISFGPKDVIIEKYASKLNEQLSKKSRNVTFAAQNEVRYIQPLQEINKDSEGDNEGEN